MTFKTRSFVISTVLSLAIFAQAALAGTPGAIVISMAQKAELVAAAGPKGAAVEAYLKPRTAGAVIELTSTHIREIARLTKDAPAAFHKAADTMFRSAIERSADAGDRPALRRALAQIERNAAGEVGRNQGGVETHGTQGRSAGIETRVIRRGDQTAPRDAIGGLAPRTTTRTRTATRTRMSRRDAAIQSVRQKIVQRDRFKGLNDAQVVEYGKFEVREVAKLEMPDGVVSDLAYYVTKPALARKGVMPGELCRRDLLKSKPARENIYENNLVVTKNRAEGRPEDEVTCAGLDHFRKKVYREDTQPAHESAAGDYAYLDANCAKDGRGYLNAALPAGGAPALLEMCPLRR